MRPRHGAPAGRTGLTRPPAAGPGDPLPLFALLALLALLALAALVAAPAALAHGVDEDDAGRLQGDGGLQPGPFLLLGAKHMMTGWDHILFLAAVVFFLYRPRHVLLYVSLFTVGHSLTLLTGVLGGIRADKHLIDAVIGLSVVYKAFDNLGGFDRVFGRSLDPRAAVFVFGLFHGFGLATALQELALAPNGLAGNLLSFNVGVEIGQVLILLALLPLLYMARLQTGFARFAVVANVLIMAGGFVLMAHQIVSYLNGGS